MIIDAILLKDDEPELYDVVYYPGGVSQIKQKEMTVYSKENNSKHFIVFDGDQQKKKLRSWNYSIEKKSRCFKKENQRFGGRRNKILF